jgi:transposase
VSKKLRLYGQALECACCGWNCFSPFLYRDRNAIERLFCCIQDFRRIATRYDRIGTNFPADVCIVAAICYWL